MESLNIFYDKEGDVLDVSIGEPMPAISKEIENDVFVRVDAKTKKIVGLMILHFEKKFSRKIPLKAQFALA